MAKQNIYDNNDFFQAYRQLRENDSGFNNTLEMPAMRALLPDVSGMDVLDLGCGAGEFCRHLQALGANCIKGIDISQKMLETAQQQTQATNIHYQQVASDELSRSAGV